MSEFNETLPDRKINWDVVLQNNQEMKDPNLQIDAFSRAMAAWEVIDPEFKNENEHEQVLLCSLISVVMSDCIEAGHIPQIPILFPESNPDTDAAARAVLIKDNQWVLFLNATTLKESANELSGYEPGSGNLETTARMIFQIAHELGHVRQGLVLDSNMDDVPNSSDLPEDAGPEEVLEFKINYSTNPIETNANAFATKYVRTKSSDPNASSLWQDIDFSQQLTAIWDNIGFYGKAKARITQAELKAIEGRVHPTKIEKYNTLLGAISKKIDTWDERYAAFMDQLKQ